MKCQKCGSELRDGAKFCDNCGAAVQLKKQSPNCEQTNKPDAQTRKKGNNNSTDTKQGASTNKSISQFINKYSFTILISFFAIVLFIVIGVVACNNRNNASYSPSSTEKSSNNGYDYNYYDDSDYTTHEQVTEYNYYYDTTEKETEEPTTEMSDALHELYSDNNITLSYYQMHDYEYDPEEKRIEFCVENKTDKQLTIQSSLVSVNGISYKGNMSDEVLPNTKGIIEMNVYQKIPVDTPSRIGITINYFDGLLGDTINEHGIVIPEIEIK